MLYRAVASCLEHHIGHFPNNPLGEFHVFVDVEPDDAVDTSAAAQHLETKLAAHWGVPVASLVIYNLSSAAELASDAIGPAHSPDWAWFETGISGGDPVYASADRMLLLIDDQRTLAMLQAAHGALVAHLAAEGYEAQREHDMHMEGPCYDLRDNDSAFDAERTALPQPLVYRSHMRIGGPGVRVKPIPGQVISRVRERQHKAQDIHRIGQLQALLPPEPPRGRSRRARWARMLWLQQRDQAIFSATFGIALSEQFAKRGQAA